MRALLLALFLPFAAWSGTLASFQPSLTADPIRLASLASLLSSLTVFVYRLGVWRQEMENTKHNIGAEVKAYRAETSVNFERLDRRLDAIDHMVSAASDRLTQATRWQARTDRRIEQLEEAGGSQ